MDDNKNEEETEAKDSEKDDWRQMGFRWIGIGFEFVLVVVGFSFLGYLLDKKSDTSPGFMIMGFFVGFITMLYIIIKRAGGIKW